MIESDIQKKYIKALQEAKIDFIRINNTSFKGKVSSPKSYAIFPDGESCTKYFADIAFVYRNKLYLREFSLKVGKQLAHKDRKEKQWKRMNHWMNEGNADIFIIDSMESCHQDLKFLGII